MIVRSGLSEGDRVLLSPLEAVTDGMRVRTLDGDTGLGQGSALATPGDGTADQSAAQGTEATP